MTTESRTPRVGGRKHHSATKYVIGYATSLFLTAIAFLMALTRTSNLPVGPIVILLMVLGALQIVVQLYFFMHVTEGDGPPFHTVFLILGLIFTFAIALMSIWIMGFPAFMAQVA